MGNQTPKPDAAIWTVGHSNHPLQTLLDLLAQHRLDILVDVRSSPYSRYAHWFNKEALQGELQVRAVRYMFLGNLLGGRAEGEEFYDDQGHVLYGRVAQSAGFQNGIGQLYQLMQGHRAVLLCGEEDPTDCHRRLLIGRVLAEQGVEVKHIRGDGRLQSEQEVAAAREFARTKGQLSLFDTAEADEWKSTHSPLRRRPCFAR